MQDTSKSSLTRQKRPNTEAKETQYRRRHAGCREGSQSTRTRIRLEGSRIRLHVHLLCKKLSNAACARTHTHVVIDLHGSLSRTYIHIHVYTHICISQNMNIPVYANIVERCMPCTKDWLSRQGACLERLWVSTHEHRVQARTYLRGLLLRRGLTSSHRGRCSGLGTNVQGSLLRAMVRLQLLTLSPEWRPPPCGECSSSPQSSRSCWQVRLNRASP